ncbi:MAG TPA: fluoride efflux transporter CrcB [Chryseobacterium sp.]|nr:fluoride efflux transporter CrcB [Chryseobacterium sp.]
MKTAFLIFLGGGIGSVFRYYISSLTHKLLPMGNFPIGTFVVNIVGCFLIGALTAFYLRADNSLKILFITGFCGGFTTFSTFSAENVTLYQEGNYITLFIYIILSILAGIAAVSAGLYGVRA